MATGLCIPYLNDQLFIQEDSCHVLPLRNHIRSFVMCYSTFIWNLSICKVFVTVLSSDAVTRIAVVVVHTIKNLSLMPELKKLQKQNNIFVRGF